MKVKCEYFWCKYWKKYGCLRDEITINYKNECSECDNSHQNEPWFQEVIAQRLKESIELRRINEKIPFYHPKDEEE